MIEAMPTGPAGLQSIRGHAEVIDRLARAVRRDRLAHALLLSGPNGVGKATTARALSQALACPRAPGLGCGQCHTCDRIRRGVHPDLLWVEAETQQIKIQQVRALEDRLAQGPNEAPALVIVLDEAERLTIAAANALLKSLEEPRPGVHIVLVSAAPHRLPITVRSRCQRFRFGPLEDADLRAVLGDLGVEPEAEVMNQAVRLADGSAARALLLLEHKAFARWRAWSERLEDPDALQADPVPVLASTLLSEVDEPEAVFGLLLPRLRDALLLSTGLDDSGRRLRLLRPESPEAKRARRMAPAALLRKMDATLGAIGDLGARVNKHLVVEQVLLQLRR